MISSPHVQAPHSHTSHLNDLNFPDFCSSLRTHITSGLPYEVEKLKGYLQTLIAFGNKVVAPVERTTADNTVPRGSTAAMLRQFEFFRNQLEMHCASRGVLLPVEELEVVRQRIKHADPNDSTRSGTRAPQKFETALAPLIERAVESVVELIKIEEHSIERGVSELRLLRDNHPGGKRVRQALNDTTTSLGRLLTEIGRELKHNAAH